MNPSDSRPARSAFAVGLYGPPSPDAARAWPSPLAAGNGSLLFRIQLCPHALLCTPRASCTAPNLFTGAVCCLRRDMSGSAIATFRLLISRGCKVRLMLGLRSCSPPTGLTTRCGLLMPHSDAVVSHFARGLLRGASALTATGLSPVSSIQRESPTVIRSGRNMSEL
jgi:hypothetical protein